ncbi:hypothetical protein [Marinobacter sp.]|uniref:hypothetical protein n=1 Tax=Marinobacter sp. TaxID=50741 RepID=UPI000C99784A|nr:hypothetical protein [Marinobacter sp.]MAB50947.1 hypothetical protein [Marinobacter sp.]
MKKKDKMKVPTILKVKDVDSDDRFDNIHPNLPQMPCLALLIGSVRSGKSNLLVNFFMNEDFYKGVFDNVRFISNTLHTDNKGVLLAKHFDCYDHYEDSMIDGIIKEQSQYERDDRPSYALIADDILTQDFSKSNALSYFATRFRHFIDFFCISTQSFRAVSGLIRNNANAVFILRQQNKMELDKIAEEYAGMVGGHDNFMKHYKDIHKEKYSVMYLDLQSNPARILRNFEEVVWEGDDKDRSDLE